MSPEGSAAPRAGSGLRIALPTGIFPPDIGGPASSVPRIAAALAGKPLAMKIVGDWAWQRADEERAPLFSEDRVLESFLRMLDGEPLDWQEFLSPEGGVE